MRCTHSGIAGLAWVVFVIIFVSCERRRRRFVIAPPTILNKPSEIAVIDAPSERTALRKNKTTSFSVPWLQLCRRMPFW